MGEVGIAWEEFSTLAVSRHSSTLLEAGDRGSQHAAPFSYCMLFRLRIREASLISCSLNDRPSKTAPEHALEASKETASSKGEHVDNGQNFAGMCDQCFGDL